MGLTYFKRLPDGNRAGRARFLAGPARAGYRLVAWDDSLLETHAETKYLSFRTEIDANVFPCLGEYAGCLRLMHEIRQKPGFLPEATWLAAHGTPRAKMEYCGTIQGIIDRSGMGAVQNLGVVPDHRGRGLGTALMRQALDGFQRVGLERAFLEVTARTRGRFVSIGSSAFAKPAPSTRWSRLRTRKASATLTPSQKR